MTKQVSYILLFISLVSFVACKDDYTPKQKGYPRIELPEKKYLTYNGACPFTFEYPNYAMVVNDSSPNSEPCWLNVRYLPFNATLHLTYKPVGPFKLEELTEQSRKYAYEHTIKAEEINDNYIVDSARHMYLTTYSLEGETATPFRFYATDGKTHFLDGAFYFDTHTSPDSIAPVQKFLLDDVGRMLDGLQWK